MNRLKYPRLSSCATDLEVVRYCLDPTGPTTVSPKMTLQQFNTHMTLSRGALYVLIFKSSNKKSDLNRSYQAESVASPC